MIAKSEGNSYVILEEKTYRVVKRLKDINELIDYLKSQREKKLEEARKILENIRYFDSMR